MKTTCDSSAKQKFLKYNNQHSFITASCTVSFFAALFFSGLLQAATYTLPAAIGTSPFNNCSLFSGTTYNCTGNITFGKNDTINVTSPMTLNLTSGDFKADDNFTINNGGNSFTISAPSGGIDIGKDFTGTVNLQAGQKIKIDDNATITGNLNASDNVEIGKDAVITGNLTAGNDIKVDKNASITGNLIAADDIIIDKDSNITGNLTAGDQLDLGKDTNVVGICTPSHSQCTPPPLPPMPIAEFRMEQSSWSGITGEVIDNTGNYSGTAASLNSTKPTTANVTPAILGNPGTCSYGQFNRTNKDYVALPNSFPNLGANPTAFTVTAWIRTTNNSLSGQRVFIDDERNNGGYGISLGDGGAGKLRFYSRGTPSALILDTGNIITNNTWYFVAVIADVPNKIKRIYIYNTAGTQLANVSASWTENSFGADTGNASIGGETNDSTEKTNSFGFSGNIDELRVYQLALTVSEIDLVRQSTHACANAIDHVRIEHDGSALTCTAETITVKACANAACSSLYTAGTVTGNITWAGTPGGSIPFTISGGGTGQTTVALPVSTAQTITLGTSTISPAPINASQCLNTSTSTNNCAMNFSTSGFLVTLSDHISCNNTTATIEAVQQGTPANRCIPAFANVTRPVNLYTTYVNPNSGTMTAISSTGNISTSSPGTAHNLAFDATGKASINFNYPDAGKLTLTANGTAPTGASMTGSATFVVAPASLAFSGIPAAPLKAGQPFNVTVSAKNACAIPAITPNFTGQTVIITSSNPQPGIGNATAINTSLTTTNGTGSTNLIWREVGTIDLTAVHSNYLGSALSVNGSQAAVGRFQPAYFDTVVTPGCNTFTYAGSTTPATTGQPFIVTTTAKAVGGSITLNYAGNVNAYLTTLSNAGNLTGLTNNTHAATDFVNGTATRNDVRYAASIPKTAPSTLIVRATNSDSPTVSSAGYTEGNTAIRNGRLYLRNAYGSELLDLPIPLEAQYWNGNAYVRNLSDSCTVISASAIAMGNYKNSLNACETQIGYSSGTGGFLNGVSNHLRLTKPGAGNNGSVDLTLNLNGASGSTCPTPTAISASNANLPWFGSNPNARATFGIYKTPIIYMRENY